AALARERAQTGDGEVALLEDAQDAAARHPGGTDYGDVQAAGPGRAHGAADDAIPRRTEPGAGRPITASRLSWKGAPAAVTARAASRTPGANAARDVVRCSRARHCPRAPKSTDWSAMTPSRRRLWTATPPRLPPRVPASLVVAGSACEKGTPPRAASKRS